MKSGNELGLGEVIVGAPERDAIHIAVVPIEAGDKLRPGDHVRVSDGKAYSTGSGERVGVIDPFLTRDVLREGERAWLFLYPGTITSLRHEWSHPDFPRQAALSDADVARTESDRWLREFAEKMDTSYEAMMGGLEQKHVCWGTSTYEYDGPSGDFWRHLEAVKGRPFVEAAKGSFFSCSC